MPAKKPIMPGTRFGRLVALHEIPGSPKYIKYMCACDCGTVHPVRAGHLRDGSATSCGCYKRELVRDRGRQTRHGHTTDNSRSPTYAAWQSMRDRCGNERCPRFCDYGGRGIKVCARWGNFERFLADMGERPEGTSLDRIDVDGNYEPGNCRWATNLEQQNNRRNNRVIAMGGQVKTVAQWCREHGANGNIVRYHLRAGKPLEVALALGAK